MKTWQPIVRTCLTLALIYGAYTETGIWTVMSVCYPAGIGGAGRFLRPLPGFCRAPIAVCGYGSGLLPNRIRSTHRAFILSTSANKGCVISFSHTSKKVVCSLTIKMGHRRGYWHRGEPLLRTHHPAIVLLVAVITVGYGPWLFKKRYNIKIGGFPVCVIFREGNQGVLV